MIEIDKTKKELKALADPEKAKILQRFFKTGKGEYGEGDRFLGICVPDQRKVARKFLNMRLEETENLLHSRIHEYRLTAVIIMVEKSKRGNEEEQEKIYKLYLKNTKWINNWDLVDLSAHYIVGAFLLDKPRKSLYSLAKSDLLWERRIAMISTFAFIRVGEFSDTLKLAKALLKDEHDLMHKAVGWMLREMGKKSDEGHEELIRFLDKHTLQMPRTMLRYSIERLPEKQRLYYLNLGKE